jgi:hypothetical protein
VSKFLVALKAARTANGVPLLADIPGVGVLFRPLPSAESALQENLIYSQATIFPTLFDLMGLRYAPAVADIDPMAERIGEFTARWRWEDLRQRSFDIGATRVDDAMRTPAGERRPDLYRPQVTIPSQHPNGYSGPGLRMRDGILQEGPDNPYDPQRAYPPTRYAPGTIPEDAMRPLPPSGGHAPAPGYPHGPAYPGIHPPVGRPSGAMPGTHEGAPGPNGTYLSPGNGHTMPRGTSPGIHSGAPALTTYPAPTIGVARPGYGTTLIPIPTPGSGAVRPPLPGMSYPATPPGIAAPAAMPTPVPMLPPPSLVPGQGTSPRPPSVIPALPGATYPMSSPPTDGTWRPAAPPLVLPAPSAMPTQPPIPPNSVQPVPPGPRIHPTPGLPSFPVAPVGAGPTGIPIGTEAIGRMSR